MTTELKNTYENLIQNMMLENINGMTPELKHLILNAPVEQQRSMILTVMEENNPEHRLLCSKIQKVVKDNKTGETNHIASIVKMLREYVKVSDTEVKTMGEVMTPIELVEEMLDTLPYEVWTNPNLKWLDPCNGVGTFMSVVVKRLMKGLEIFEPVAELRYRHIMENMIFSCELQAKNVFLYMYAFDPEDELALNVYNGSYLDEGFDNHMKFWGVEKFDVIVMNPPYQELKEGNKKSQSLWDKFVVKTINQLIEGGYLVAVHPSGWRNVDGAFKNIQNLLKERQMQYLNINNYKKGFETFGAYTDYDYYCLRNVLNSKVLTKIVDIDDNVVRIDISEMPFIPKCNIQEVLSLVAKNNENTVKILYTCSYHTQKIELMSNEKTEEFKYSCVMNVTTKDEIGCTWYSNTKDYGHFGIPKVIFGRKNCGVFVDEYGEYGMTQDCTGIIDDVKNLPFIQKALKSEHFIKNIMGFRESFGDKYNRKIIATFRKDFWVDFLK